MDGHRLVPVVMAVVGFVTIVIGVYQGLVHVAPGYEGTITSGWDGTLSHEEVLLAQIGAVGVGGAVAGLRWKRLASIPVVAGSIVLFYTLRATFNWLWSPTRPLYREFSPQAPGFEGETMLILGTEPFLLAVGGVLLIGSGIVRVKSRTPGEESGEVIPPSSQA